MKKFFELVNIQFHSSRVYLSFHNKLWKFSIFLVLLCISIEFSFRTSNNVGDNNESDVVLLQLWCENCSIVGLVKKSFPSGKEFLSFTSVSYGHIPRRFAPALLRDPSGFIDARVQQKACIQPVLHPFLTGNFTEDCLTLNVYTPRKEVWENRKLPVMVFVHGGSFFRWSANMFDPRRMMDKDVVLVTINYRLNLFGFFCLENDDSPGNLGLYDQVLALQWVQRNIASFGGDPGRVTIVGQSAGAAAVSYLLHSPLTKGLFHGVIASSGDSSAGWAVAPKPLQNSLTAAKALGCSNETRNNLQVALKCMQSLPAETILTGVPHFYSAPVIQDFSMSLPKISPTPTNAKTHLQSVPLMIGIHKNDGAFLLSRIYTDLKSKNLHLDTSYLKNHFVKELLTSSHFGLRDDPNGTLDGFIERFIGEEALKSGDFKLMAPGLTKIYNEYYFTRPAQDTAFRHESPVYFYSFDYEGEQTLYPYMGGVPQVPRGTSHGDELMYLFHFQDLQTSEEREISTKLITAWVNFATTGNPNRPALDSPQPKDVWPKFLQSSKRIMKINLVTEVSKLNIISLYEKE